MQLVRLRSSQPAPSAKVDGPMKWQLQLVHCRGYCYVFFERDSTQSQFSTLTQLRLRFRSMLIICLIHLIRLDSAIRTFRLGDSDSTRLTSTSISLIELNSLVAVDGTWCVLVIRDCLGLVH